MCHGLWGSVSHLKSLEEVITDVHARRSTGPDDPVLHVLSPRTNESDLTYDGIDLCAHRAILEIDEYISSLSSTAKDDTSTSSADAETVPERRRVTRFSIVGYSLGGLIARYVVGVLESRSPSLFETVEAVNFTTFASPAIGIPRFPSFVSRATSYLGARILSNTGQQIYVEDDYLNGKPLLELMAQPGESARNHSPIVCRLVN